MLTNDQQKAYDLCLSGANAYVAGIAGAGKSYLISEIKEAVETQGQKCVVTSTTNFSARQVCGETIHHLLKYNPKMNMDEIDYEKKSINLHDVDVLIIDEISMLSARTFDYVAECIEATENVVQLIVFGDFYQLSPVKEAYAFESESWSLFGFEFAELNECVRQKNREFVNALLNVRIGGTEGLKWIVNHCSKKKKEDAISICPTNAEVDKINQDAYDNSTGEVFENLAQAESAWNKDSYEFEIDLKLKVGMKVRFIANDAEGGSFYRGDFGTFVGYEDGFLIVELEKSGEKVQVGLAEFQCDKKSKEGETVAVKQYPVVLGYAITVHKAQGQTFTSANVYLERAWELGMVYVALSRVKTVENLWIGGLPRKKLALNHVVANFYQSFQKKVA